MNLKYYLRGLGIGIVVTAVVMGVAGNGRKEQLSDAEIKTRAAQLGMVESSGLLSELEETPEVTLEPTEIPVTPMPTKTPESTEIPATPAPTKTPEPTEIPTTPMPTKTPEISKTPEVTKTSENTGIIIEIKPGDGSDAVSRKLEESGLIASASAFDAYLCENGIDKKLQVGIYEIPTDASPEEIAKLFAK